MFSETAPITTYLTPDDRQVPDELVKLVDGAQQTVRFIIYGCTLQAFFDAIVRAVERGVDVKGIFDHSQAVGPKEAAALHALWLKVAPDSFRIGTSEVAHQIVHLKGLWVDGRTVWSGSYNFSDSAAKQVNHADVVESESRAAAFQRAFDELWTWISAHEPQYQEAVSHEL